MKRYLLIALVLFVSAGAKSQVLDSIPSKEAKNYYNKVVKVYGIVSGGRWLDSTFITLLNIDGNYPHNMLTVMIKDNDRKKFNYSPESFLKGKKVLVTGTVVNYKGKPEIIVTEPNQIKVL